MLFNSLEFLIFFPIVAGLYFACPHRYRWVWLLGASYYFYAAWQPEYVLLMIGSTLISYLVGRLLAGQTDHRWRAMLLGVGLVSNLSILIAFKYANFINDSLRASLNQLNIFYDVELVQVLLPVGISFYTFQVTGYLIDVYRGRTPPERHLGLFALFVAFFPQLVAGPIERAGRMLPQFRATVQPDAARITSGLRLILWGLFKKMVIADRLGLYVDAVYNQPGDFSGWPVLIATLFFGVQIYCDFSGYTDIAIGAARILGIDLMENFRRPFFASSPSDFWRRWHISLSTWFRDYLYIPLGGNRVGMARWYTNLMIVFLISGLWHGANWTFAIWGGLHGLFVIIEYTLRRLRPASGQPPPGWLAALGGGVTLAAINLSWLWFRANSVGDGFLLLSRLAPLTNPADSLSPWTAVTANPAQQMSLSLGLIVLLLTVHLGQEWGWRRVVLRPRLGWLRWAAYLFLALSILNLGVAQATPFIYFQF